MVYSKEGRELNCWDNDMKKTTQMASWLLLLLGVMGVFYLSAKLLFSGDDSSSSSREGPQEHFDEEEFSERKLPTVELSDEAEPFTSGEEEEVKAVLTREDVRVDVDLLAASAWQLLQKHQGLLIAVEEFRATGGDMNDITDAGRTEEEVASESKRVYDDGMEFGLIIHQLEEDIRELNEIYREILLRLKPLDEDMLTDIFSAKKRAWRGLEFKLAAFGLVDTHFERLKRDSQLDMERVSKDYEKEAQEFTNEG